jgi:hypothetical protein
MALFDLLTEANEKFAPYLLQCDPEEYQGKCIHLEAIPIIFKAG